MPETNDENAKKAPRSRRKAPADDAAASAAPPVKRASRAKKTAPVQAPVEPAAGAEDAPLFEAMDVAETLCTAIELVEASAVVIPDDAARHATIAARAHAIWRVEGGTAFDNWLRAERELSR
jgi:hypothetical protein